MIVPTSVKVGLAGFLKTPLSFLKGVFLCAHGFHNLVAVVAVFNSSLMLLSCVCRERGSRVSVNRASVYRIVDGFSALRSRWGSWMLEVSW